MLQLNDADHTLIDLTKKNLTGISYRGHFEIRIKFKLEDVIIETEFEYNTISEAQDDYQMLIDMIDNTPSLLTEDTNVIYGLKRRWIEKKT
jgi:hypothetical protein